MQEDMVNPGGAEQETSRDIVLTLKRHEAALKSLGVNVEDDDADWAWLEMKNQNHEALKKYSDNMDALIRQLTAVTIALAQLLEHEGDVTRQEGQDR